MIKKLFSILIFMVLLVACTITPALANGIFPDVTDKTYPWAVNEINDMVELGIIKGYTDGTFKPDRAVTKMESLVLISRILGYTDENNADFTALAIDLYDDVLQSFDIAYKGEVSYLLYKGVLKESELKYYIGKDNVDTALKRYEAAILLTKAMGAEGDIGFSELVYTDASEIPATAKDYVSFVTEIGLMNGMNKTQTVNEFVPNFEVNRAQIAVLLYRMMDIIDQTITFGLVTDVNTNTRTIMFINDQEKTDGIAVPYDDFVSIKIDGYSSAIDKITPASKIAVIRRGGELCAIETITVIPDETFEGIVSSIYMTTNYTRLTLTKLGETEKYDYQVPKDVAVVYEGHSGKLSDIKKSDFVSLEIKDGEVVRISATDKNRTIKGTINAMFLEPELKFQILLTDGALEEYTVADDVLVKRNGSTADISSVLVGDKVTVVLAYEQISSVTATGKSSSVTGTVEEFTVATLPSIKIKTSENKISTYSVSRDAVYVIDGVENANIYSLRLGASITVNLESDTVVKITSVSSATSTTILGTITTINKSYGFFILEVTNAVTGNVTQTQVFTKKTSLAVINGADGKTKTVNDLAAGMRVSVTGIDSMGAFEATTIVIQP